MAAVVLVHGLFHRPEHFTPVAERLRTARTEVVVPDLHRGSLPAHTAAVQAAIDSLPEPPTVLGHSYGGSVITGVRGAGHLVYPAAIVPDVAESAASLGGASSQLQDAITPDPDGSTSLHPDRAADILLRRLSRTSRRLGGWPAACASLRLRARHPRAQLETHSLHLRRLRAGSGHRPGPAAEDGLALHLRARVADGSLPVRRTARSGR